MQNNLKTVRNSKKIKLQRAIVSCNLRFSLYQTLANKSKRSFVYHPQLVAVYHQPIGLDIIKPLFAGSHDVLSSTK